VAVYSNNIVLAPGRNSLTLAQYTKEAVASSIGSRGAIGLIVSADKNSTRLQVEFCRVEERGGAHLTGIESGIVPTSNISMYSARFRWPAADGGSRQHILLPAYPCA
jgi:hypothetical protein